MLDPARERWPPIYDADELARTIEELVSGPDFPKGFWLPGIDEPPVCQGDIIELTAPVPLLDERGEAVADGDVRHWIVLGNSCDFDRDVRQVPWSQIAPIEEMDALTPEHLTAFRRYRLTRRFYIPSWDAADGHRYADFLRPVAIQKDAFKAAAKVVARLSRRGWVLFHCCLVRFLARDDGRYDVGEE